MYVYTHTYIYIYIYIERERFTQAAQVARCWWWWACQATDAHDSRALLAKFRLMVKQFNFPLYVVHIYIYIHTYIHISLLASLGVQCPTHSPRSPFEAATIKYN